MKTSFILILVALLACGVSFAQCPPTSLPFIDNFDSPDLDSCWTWLNEDTSHWSLTERPGWMRIVAQSGQDIENRCCVKNKLARSVSDQDLRITTRLALSPWMDYQQAGILAFLDQDNYIYVARTHNAGLGGQVVFIHSEDDGTWSETHTSMTDTVSYLRIDKLGSEYTGYASSDSIQWTYIGRFDNDLVADSTVNIGLFALTGREEGVGEIPADFDYFRVDSLPGTNVCGDVSGVWDSTGSPYYVTCDVTVPAGQTLQIGPGVQVLFTGHYKFNVFGNLQAIGTEEDSIVFTRAFPTEGSEWWGIRIRNAHDTCRVKYCTIEYARAASGAESYDTDGGGIFAYAAAIEVEHTRIQHGYASDDGGGMRIEAAPYATVRRCTFIDNFADDSGGDVAAGALQVSMSQNVSVGDVLFYNNRSDGNGGAVVVYHCPAHLDHCTFFRNTSGQSGSAIFNRQGVATVVNSIAWYNSGIGGPLAQENGAYTVSFSDIQGGYPGIGNIDTDPMFVDTANGDFHLQEGSPCIDAGDPTLFDPDCTPSDIGAFYYFHLAQPESLTAQQQGSDMVLRWSVVDSTECGFPSPIQSYVVFYEQDFNEEWDFLAATQDTFYVHENVLLFPPPAPRSHYYDVVATDIEIDALNLALHPGMSRAQAEMILRGAVR